MNDQVKTIGLGKHVERILNQNGARKEHAWIHALIRTMPLPLVEKYKYKSQPLPFSTILVNKPQIFNRIAWQLLLFDFTILYTLDRYHTIPDCLTRLVKFEPPTWVLDQWTNATFLQFKPLRIPFYVLYLGTREFPNHLVRSHGTPQ